MDRDALAHFLRRRRAALAPEDVGLRHTARRRTAGLRREEVAQLASMSTDFYTRLEQRRGARPSPQVAGAIASALRLTPDERDHLFRLAGHATPPRTLPTGAADPALLRVMEHLDTPAQIKTSLGVTLAENAASVELFGDTTGLEGLRASVIYRWFTEAGTRARFPAADHDRHARSYVAHLRAVSGRQGDDPDVMALIAALCDASPRFVELWERHDVVFRTHVRKDVVHPQRGVLAYDCQILRSDDEAQQLVVFTPVN